MRITLALLLLAGCAGTPTGTNGIAEKAPPSPPPVGPGPDAPPQGPDTDAYRAAIEANEEPFRSSGIHTAYLGDDIRVDGNTIRPVEVLEDSRCPIDATCVWAGRVRVRVRVSVGGASGESVMEVNRPMAIVLRDGRVELKLPAEGRGFQQLTLVAVAPLNWARPPAGVDPNARKRFAFTLID